MASVSGTGNASHNYPIASLYVGDLEPEVTEAVLFEKFSAVGQVLSIRVCRDIITRHSLGYAYVNYQNAQDAERAIDTLNFEKLGGRPIRIMWSQRDPSLRRSGVGNIFIKNLDKTVDNKVLFDTFSVFGNILSCKVSFDDKSVSKGYGFVHFDSEEAANSAIENLNNKIILDKKIFVGKFLARRERDHKGGSLRRFTNVYVKNLGDEFDCDEKLVELFEPFGAITSAIVATDGEKKSKGFGFVCFEEPDAAEAAVNALNGKECSNGKNLFVGRAQKKAEREAEMKRKNDMLKMERINRSQGVNLYVKNLEDTINDERLQQSFAAYGTITSAKVMCDDKGRSKGFGFVCFSTPEEATKAVTEMNNKIIVTKPLYVALAQRKEDREAQKLNMRYARGPMSQIPPQQLGGQWPNPNAFPNTIAGLPQTQQQGYLLPIAPNGQVRAFYQNQIAGQVPGQVAPMRTPRPWQNVNMNRHQINQYNSAYRGSNPRVAQQGVRGPAMAGQVPISSVRGAFNPNQGRNQGPHRVPQVPRGQPKPMTAPMGQPMPMAFADPKATGGDDPLQVLGEELYAAILPHNPELAGKITGMILEMSQPEIIQILQTPEMLKAKIDEAVKVLNEHGGEKPE